MWELGYLWCVCDLSCTWFLESFFCVAVCVHICVFLWGKVFAHVQVSWLGMEEEGMW